MILRVLKSNNFANLFLVPIAVFAFWAGKLFAPAVYPFAQGEVDNVLYKMVYRLTELIISRYQFIRIRTRLPAILFVLLVGGLTSLHTLHPVYFGAVFLLLALFRFFGMFGQTKAYTIIFDVGFLLGIGSLFYVNLFIVVPAFLIGISILSHGVSWREYLIMLLGFALPFVFALSYFFYTDQLFVVSQVFVDFVTQPINNLHGNLMLQIYLGILVFISLIASIDIAKHYDSKKVSSRKYFMVFFFIFLFSMVSFVFIPVTSQEMLIISAIPLTFLLSNYLVFLKSRFWGELFFFSLLVAIIVIQFFG